MVHQIENNLAKEYMTAIDDYLKFSKLQATLQATLRVTKVETAMKLLAENQVKRASKVS